MALPTTSSSGCHCRLSCTAPDSSRAISSRLLTSAAMRIAELRIDRTSSRCSSVGGGLVSWTVSASPTSEASGVRRSWEMVDSSELRKRSDSICTVVFCATSM